MNLIFIEFHKKSVIEGNIVCKSHIESNLSSSIVNGF